MTALRVEQRRRRAGGVGSAWSLLAAIVAACEASDGAALGAGLGAANETIAVEVQHDGFVTTGGRRQPREAFVLEMRQHMRALDDEARLLVRVRVTVIADGDELVARDTEWLIDQLHLMGVRQIQYL